MTNAIKLQNKTLNPSFPFAHALSFSHARNNESIQNGKIIIPQSKPKKKGRPKYFQKL